MTIADFNYRFTEPKSQPKATKGKIAYEAAEAARKDANFMMSLAKPSEQ